MDWNLRSDAENFKVNITFLKQYVQPLSQTVDTPMVFSHVPKTAGTSFESYLSSQFNISQILHVNAPDLNKLPQVIHLKKDLPKLICGHHPIHGLLYQLLPKKPFHHITVIRDPIDRVLSYYNYVVGKKDHPMHNSGVSMGFDDFINNSPSPELHNGQARRFAGQLHTQNMDSNELFTTANEVLKQCFSEVFTTCKLGQAVITLHEKLSFSRSCIPKSNRSRKMIKREELSQSQLNNICRLNQVDIKLFDLFVKQ